MPVTTVDLTDEAKDYLDKAVRERRARSARDAILTALQFYETFHMDEWREGRYLWRGFRKIWIGEGILGEVMKALQGEKLKEIGLRAGYALRDYFMPEVDLSKSSNWKLGLQHLTELGWGIFNVMDGHIVVKDPALAKDFLQGFLETALDVKLESSPTAERLLVFNVLEKQKEVKVRTTSRS